MCGRFVSARKRLELLEEFAAERDAVPADRDPGNTDYNVAPTKRIYAVLDRESEEDQGRQQRELRLLRWGLVPFWAKSASGGARMINARAETVAVKPAFRAAFAKRRCIIPADGYYEWQAAAEGAAAEGKAGGKEDTADGKKPKQSKQPFYIYRTDGGILAFAGIYELWRDTTLPDDHEHAWLWTASIITTDATDEIGRIHDRTPMVVPPDGWADWLDPANRDKELLLATMCPATESPGGGLTSHPVSTAVNSVRNNGPDLIEPMAATQSPNHEAPGPSASQSDGPGSGGTEGPTLF